MYMPLIEDDQIMHKWDGTTFPSYQPQVFVKPFLTGDLALFKDPSEDTGNEQTGGVIIN